MREGECASACLWRLGPWHLLQITRPGGDNHPYWEDRKATAEPAKAARNCLAIRAGVAAKARRPRVAFDERYPIVPETACADLCPGAIALQGPVEVPVRRTNLARQQFLLGRTKKALDNGELGREASRTSGDLFNVAMFDAAYAGCPVAVGRAACRQRREDSRRLLLQSMPPSNPMFARFELAIGQEALAHGEVEAAHSAFTRSLQATMGELAPTAREAAAFLAAR